MKESEILRRRGRMVGSDDLLTSADICRYGVGLRGYEIELAKDFSEELEDIIEFSTANRHMLASREARRLGYILKEHDGIANLNIFCRDGKRRKLIDVVFWFAGCHKRIALDIKDAEEDENGSLFDRVIKETEGYLQKELAA